VNSRSFEPIAIADDFYLMALDERSGRPRLHSRAMGLGLAAGLLCELIRDDHLTVKADRLEALAAASAPVDPIHVRMLDHVHAEPVHDLSTWLSFFAQSAVDAVADRLVGHGILTVEMARGLLRSKPVYVPVDMVQVSWRSLRIEQVIARGDAPEWPDRALVGLLCATGLIEPLLVNNVVDLNAQVAGILAALVSDPALHALIFQVEALIAAGVLGSRK
jgi:Golgi phosphoprotein 3 GPP34